MRKNIRRLEKIAALGLLEWTAFFGLWLLFENQLNLYELLYGAGAALVAAIGFEIIRTHHLASFRPRVRWILEGWRLPWYVIEGCWSVAVELVKQAFNPQKTPLHSIVFDAGGADAASAARRALAIFYIDTVPTSVVLSIDLDKDVMIMHQIGGTSTSAMTKRLGAKS